jgi:hypothetical protein
MSSCWQERGWLDNSLEIHSWSVDQRVAYRPIALTNNHPAYKQQLLSVSLYLLSSSKIHYWSSQYQYISSLLLVNSWFPLSLRISIHPFSSFRKQLIGSEYQYINIHIYIWVSLLSSCSTQLIHSTVCRYKPTLSLIKLSIILHQYVYLLSSSTKQLIISITKLLQHLLSFPIWKANFLLKNVTYWKIS